MIMAIRWFLHLAILRPIVFGLFGVNLYHRAHLPDAGPAIVVANHNSHLDTLVLMAMFPLRLQEFLRPVAASDYFLRNRCLAWIALNLLGIIPLKRGGYCRNDGDPLAGCVAALDRNEILIVYPEGSRGEPERRAVLKTGIAHLSRRRPEVPVVPVFLHGVGKVLPRGAMIPVPFICDATVGRAITWTEDRVSFMAALETEMTSLAGEKKGPAMGAMSS